MGENTRLILNTVILIFQNPWPCLVYFLCVPEFLLLFLVENIFMEPHPDYLLDDGSDSYYGDETDYHPANGGVDEDVLIQPKKLMNPCLQSKERRDLHKELLFNHKQ